MVLSAINRYTKSVVIRLLLCASDLQKRGPQPIRARKRKRCNACISAVAETRVGVGASVVQGSVDNFDSEVQ